MAKKMVKKKAAARKPLPQSKSIKKKAAPRKPPKR